VFINELVSVHDNIGVVEKLQILTFNCWDVARRIPWHWSSQTSRSSPVYNSQFLYTKYLVHDMGTVNTAVRNNAAAWH
jgi:hypothetical protein